MATLRKQYGLILPKKQQLITSAAPVKTLSVFNDSNSDEESPNDWMQRTLEKEKYGSARSKRSKAEIERVLKEDPTVYQYDEVYDEMDRTRNETLAAKQLEKVERKPRYVQHLMATAERRKKENERRIARQIQKEREAEGDEFADKEVFVTTAYKKKLEEMKAAEEKEKEQDRLEEIGDVTKQKDLGGFYRHLYERVILDDSEIGSFTKVIVDSEDEAVVSEQSPNTLEKKQKSKTSRQYRKRKSDSEPSDEETPFDGAVKHGLRSNTPLDKNIVQGNRVEKTSSENKSTKPDNSGNVENVHVDSRSSENDNEDEVEDIVSNKDKNEEVNDIQNNENTEKEENKPPKRSIWEKRTVGELYDAALQRFYERKANRLTASGNYLINKCK